jgi:glycosyltransferase involved in cell wall biosynthesis
MAAGTPVVLTDACEIAPMLSRQQAALSTDGSPTGLADAVQHLLSDSASYNALRSRALEEVEKSYSIDAIAEQLLQTYRGAVFVDEQ